jgi:hypothetical protein
MNTTRIAAAAALLFSAAPLAAQQQDFRWSGRLAQGQEIEIRNLNGNVRAEPSLGSEVEVVGHRRGDDAELVEVRMVRQGDGVTICAVFPSSGNGRGRHDGDGRDECSRPGRRTDRRNLDARVDFVVRVPAGVELAAHTVSGDVSAQGLRGRVTARSVSGNVNVSSAGPVDASSVSGNVVAAPGRGGEEMKFSSVSGNVTVRVPGGLNADFHGSTVSGDIESQLPVTSERRGPRNRWVDVRVGEEVRGTFGRGGPRLSVETVSGDIRVERAR